VGKLRVYISVPEVYASAIKSDETVTLTLDAFPGENFAGTLVRDSNSIDLTSRTLKVEVDVDNPTGSLLPGAYAFVHLKLPSTARAVTIPTNTLLFRAEGLRVTVVRGVRRSGFETLKSGSRHLERISVWARENAKNYRNT
jgi:multidrug efflux pump subunit AcrA (membrane-fusion protein)